MTKRTTNAKKSQIKYEFDVIPTIDKNENNLMDVGAALAAMYLSFVAKAAPAINAGERVQLL
ncbi:hypothetical protein [Sulfuriferula multivorans]|uniref:hypothetical protein n=1 Tax=Sulfuriferula multivorans TaxID=1559896 RepID=UPI000F5BE4D3|nr:hypothetical protein [Sulfuriferula multivorans]